MLGKMVDLAKLQVFRKICLWIFDVNFLAVLGPGVHWPATSKVRFRSAAWSRFRAKIMESYTHGSKPIPISGWWFWLPFGFNFPRNRFSWVANHHPLVDFHSYIFERGGEKPPIPIWFWGGRIRRSWPIRVPSGSRSRRSGGGQSRTSGARLWRGQGRRCDGWKPLGKTFGTVEVGKVVGFSMDFYGILWSFGWFMGYKLMIYGYLTKTHWSNCHQNWWSSGDTMGGYITLYNQPLKVNPWTSPWMVGFMEMS